MHTKEFTLVKGIFTFLVIRLEHNEEETDFYFLILSLPNFCRRSFCSVSSSVEASF